MGSTSARIDDKGRLKIPSTYRTDLQSAYGRDVFVTSLTGESVLVYPMPVWLDVQRRLAQVPSTLPAKKKYLDWVNYYGLPGEVDPQGRLLIQPALRESARMQGEVRVLGLTDHFEVWNEERFVALRLRAPFTDDDARELSTFGV